MQTKTSIKEASHVTTRALVRAANRVPLETALRLDAHGEPSVGGLTRATGLGGLTGLLRQEGIVTGKSLRIRALDRITTPGTSDQAILCIAVRNEHGTVKAWTKRGLMPFDRLCRDLLQEGATYQAEIIAERVVTKPSDEVEMQGHQEVAEHFGRVPLWVSDAVADHLRVSATEEILRSGGRLTLGNF